MTYARAKESSLRHLFQKSWPYSVRNMCLVSWQGFILSIKLKKNIIKIRFCKIMTGCCKLTEGLNHSHPSSCTALRPSPQCCNLFCVCLFILSEDRCASKEMNASSPRQMWTLSQSHSMAEVRSDPWRPSSPTDLLKARSARTSCPRPCPVRFQNFQPQ